MIEWINIILINQKKRQRSIISDGSDSEAEVKSPSSWPRFLLMQSENEPNAIKKLSPFAISKGIQAIGGTPASVKKLRSGDILVEVTQKAHAENLLRTKNFVNIPVKITPHWTLNSKMGVIRCKDLLECSDDLLVDELKSQGVIRAKRIVISKQDRTVRTNTIILTFQLSSLPPTIKCGYLQVPVDPYIPNPLRCFKCQRFGHHQGNCDTEKAVCAKCGSKDHADKDCSSTHCCVNCKGAHTAFSRDCPVWIKEKRIQEVRIRRNLSFPEARKIVEGVPTQTIGTSYAQAASNNNFKQKIQTNEIHCQTDLTWVKSDSPKALISVLKESHKPINAKQPQPSTSVSTQATTEPTKSKKHKSKSNKSDDNFSLPKPQNADATKPKKQKVLKQFNSTRESKGSRFNALRDLEVELQLHADGDIGDDMEVVPETPLTPEQPSDSSSNDPNKT